MYSLGEAVGYIRLEMGKFLSDAEKAKTSTKQIEDEFDKLSVTVKNIESIFIKSFAAIGAAVVSGLGTAVNVGSQFEASMSQVAATMGMTAEDVANGSADFEKLSAVAKEMGETTKFSASQAADALNYLALAGYNTEQAISTLPTVLNLAASGGMDLARASNMITDAASALGLSLDDMSLFADKMAKAAQSSNTSVEQLGNAILQIGGTAKNLSGGVTELNTALGILANNGIKSAEGGTALRQIILNLTAPTEKAAAYMEELGLKVADLEGNVRPLNEIFADLDEILQSKGITGSADKIKALSQIFDARQLKSATALLNNYGEQWDRLYDKIDNAEGAASRMAETMETNLKGALTILGSTAEGFGITVYESIESSFKDAVQEATNQLSNLNDAFKSSEMQQSLKRISDAISDAIVKLSEFLGETIPKLVSGLSDLIDNFDKISAGIAGMATTISLAAGGMALYKIQTDLVTQSLIAQKLAQLAANAAMLANPYTLVAVGVGTLVAALVGLYNQQKENINVLDEQNKKYYEAESEIDKMAEQYDKEIQKAKELENSRNDEINQVNELLGIIEKNVDETGKIISNTELVKNAIDELNAIIPTNIEYQGNQIKNYQDLTQASKDYCEQLKNEAILEARQEEYKTASVALDNAIKKRQELTDNFLEAQEAYNKVQKAYEKFRSGVNNYDLELKKAAEEANMSYTDFINASLKSTENALNSAQDAYLENERLISETKEITESFTNDYYQLMFNANQEVTGVWKNQTEARIGIAQEEANKLAEINKQAAQNRLNSNKENANEIINNEEELEAKIEQLEIDFNTGIIVTEEDYHKRRLELLENFQGEWSKKTSQWLKQEKEYADQHYNNTITAEEELEAELEQLEIDFNTGLIATEEEYHRRRLQLLENFQGEWTKKTSQWLKQEKDYTEKSLDDIAKSAEKIAEEAQKTYDNNNKEYFEKLKYRSDTDETYTKEMYKNDLVIFQNTLEEGSDLYRQIGREIAKTNEDIAKEAAESLRKPFDVLKDQKKYNAISWDSYISELEKYSKTLDKTSLLYAEVMQEITNAKEKQIDETNKLNKQEFEAFKQRKRGEKDYTNDVYVSDLKVFSETLDKKSDTYQQVLNEIENANKDSFQKIKDDFEINEINGYTLEQYLQNLNNFLATLDEGSETYIAVQKEISKTQEKISKQAENNAKAEKQKIEDNQKKYLNSLKRKLKEDKTYTKEMYVNDLQEFAKTLDKESDMYQTVLSEIASVRKDISNENQKSADTAFKAWETGFKALKKEAENSYNEIVKKQEKLEETLNGQIKLYETKTKKVLNLTTGLWEDTTIKKTSTSYLKEQTRELETYQKSLERLEAKGISSELMQEILGMDEESAREYVKQLNSMSTESLKTYDKAYTDLKAKNKEFSEKYYADEVEEFKKNWGNKIQEYLKSLPQEAKLAAREIVQSFVDGLADTDYDVSNDMFNDLFNSLLGTNFYNKIENGELFENYGKKSVDTLANELNENSNELKSVCDNLGKKSADAFSDGMDSSINKIIQSAKNWTETIKNVISNELSTLNVLDKDIKYSIPQTILTNPTVNTDNRPLDIKQTNTLTKDDIISAIKSAIPNGDIIMNVDGDNFAKISRNRLNILAQQSGNLSLQV